MKTKKIAIVLLISLFVISLVWADNKATLSKTDIQKVQKVERVKVEKVEAEKEVVEKAEAPNLSSKGDVAVEKKATLIEVKKVEAPTRTTPEIKKVDEAEKEIAEKLAAEKAKRAMLPSTSAKGTKAEELRRRVPGPKADFPQERKKALESGKVFKVTGDRDLIDVQVSVTVDNYPSEASWNLWSYDDGAYFYATNQTFSAAYENQTVIFSLTLGSLYSVDCWDTYGDGGIAGIVTDVPTGGILVSWSSTDYDDYGSFDFVAEEGAAPPPCDVIEDPCWITSIPATVTGNSCEYNNDYDEECPSGSTSPDVVYAYTPEVDIALDLSMCSEGNWYDTKLYIYENEETPGAPYACNDDACSNSHQNWLSLLENIEMFAGNTYYIIVDGWGGECGDYELIITEFVPCVVECPEWGIPEGEVCPEDGYVDNYNGGCNSDPPIFSPIACGETVCGIGSTYLFDGSNYRDTDWYEVILTQQWQVTFTGEAEFPFVLGLIEQIVPGVPGCDNITGYISPYALGDLCEEVFVQTILNPGTYYFFFAPSVYDGYPCDSNNDYVATLTCEPPGQGETCETAIPYTYVGDPAVTGTIDPNEAVWYSFEADQEYIEVYVDLCDSDYDTKLEVWYDCADTSYAYYNDDYCVSQSWIQTGCIFEGDVWYAKVYGCGSASGTYVLDITGLPGTCPEPPPNDLCENAEYIGPPYPASGSGTTIAATLDCPGVLDWNGVWYLFDLPYAENEVTIDICGVNEDISTVGIVLMDDCLCDDYIIRDESYFYECPSGFDGYHMEWWNIPGPGQMYWPAYAVASGNVGMDFDYTLDVAECVPCVVECPEWGIPEGEVCPEDGYVDNYNGGCNSDPPVFSPINCGETICGTASTFIFDGSNYRDTDWYEFTLEPGNWEITWEGEAEFPLLLFIIDAGSGDCVDYTILTSGDGNPCDVVTLTAVVTGGLYWLGAGPSVYSGWTCIDDHYDYVAILTCEELPPQYCPASGGCDEYIERIEIGTIDNTSLCDEYADYTYLSTDLLMGVGAPLTLTGGAYSSDVGGAWVDWNQDLDFYDDGEYFYLGTGVGPYTADIIPTAGALEGPTRMRVRLCYGCDLAPCGSTSYGEVEDYTVNVLPSPETSLIIPEYLEGCPGQSVSIPVYLDNPDSWEIEGIDMVITFDETVLDATGGILGPELADLGYGLFVNTNVNGEVTVVIYAMTDLFNGSGDVVLLDFNVVGAEGTYSDLTFTFGEVNETPVGLFDCFFNVIPCAFDVSGFIGYYVGLAPVPDADVNLTAADYTTTTDEFGEYLFEDIPGGNYVSTPSKSDDLGGLSGLDASRIARFSVGLYEFDCMQWITSDVSMNGSTSGMDASRVARYAVGLIDALNTDDTEWVFTVEWITDCPDWEPILYENAYYYTPLESDLVDQDFFGIRLGDVTGNWSPLVREPLNYESFEITEIETGINSTLRIPVVIDKISAIEGIDISIAFDPEVLKLTELTLIEGILDNKDYATETNINESGKGIMVIYAQRELVSESGVVAFIEFNVIGAVGTSSEIAFNKFDVNEIESSGGLQVVDSEGNEIITKRLEANVVETLPEKFTLYPNYPNPFTSKTVIRYDLPKDTHVTIQIYNVRGQLVKELVNGIESAGRKQIEWNSKDMSSGIYFYRLSTKDKTFIKKMIIIKR